jgi:chemotaxis protein MotB
VALSCWPEEGRRLTVMMAIDRAKQVVLGAAGVALVVAAGCVTQPMVNEDEGQILAVRRQIGALEKRFGRLRGEIRRLEAEVGSKAAEERRARFASDLARWGLTVTSRGPELVVTVASTVLFDPGEVSVREVAREPLEALAKAIGVRYPKRLVRIEGHTDNSPPKRVARAYPTNWELSAARALAVVSFLVEKGKIPRGKVFAAAYGQHRPVGSNDTPEGRDSNRRVDIVVMPPVGIETVATADLGK